MNTIIKKLAVMATALVSAVTFSAASITYTNNSDRSITASAAATYLTNSQITAKLTALKSRYPNGSKWLTPNTVKYGGKQCYAFARQLAVDVFGTYPTTNVVYAKDGDKNNGWTAIRNAGKVILEPGDIIRSDYNSHTAMIWKIEGNTVYVAQCYGSQNNKINWGTFWGEHNKVTIKDLLGAGFNGVWKHPGGTIPNKKVKPSTSKLTANTSLITKGGSISFTASSDTGTAYTIGIDKSGKRWKTAAMPNGKLTVSFNEEGSYTAYVTASNSAGYCDSAKISFTVKIVNQREQNIDRNSALYFPKYSGNSKSIVDALNSLGINSNFSYRKSIAAANSIGSPYTGSATENTKMLNLLKQGKLKRPENSTTNNTRSTKKYFPKYTGSSGSIVEALKAVGADSSYAFRQKIAAANDVNSYSGTLKQNVLLLNKLKNGTLVKP